MKAEVFMNITKEQLARIQSHKVMPEVTRFVNVLGLSVEDAIAEAIKVSERRHNGYVARVAEERARDYRSRSEAGATMLFC